MSLQAMTWVFNEAPVTDPSTLLVLLALADHADRDGCNAFPSRETIASYARLTTRSVSTKLAALLEAGIIALGDQQKVAHIPSGRRPKVYDIQVGVKNLHPTGSGYPAGIKPEYTCPNCGGPHTLAYCTHEVKSASPVGGEGSFTGGVKDTTERGEVQRHSGVKLTSHKPNRTQEEEPIGVVEVPQQEPLDLSRQDTHWRPSPAALAQAKQGVRLADINLSITTYEVWCKRKGRTPNNGDWLSWVLRDEKDAREAERERARASRKYQGWAHVEE